MYHSSDFLDEGRIHKAIQSAHSPSFQQVSDVLDHAMERDGLSIEETAVLLNVPDGDQSERLFDAARTIKEEIYGKRIVLFAPLYLSNHCVNNCLYCGFRRDNTDLARKALNKEEIESEVRILLAQGHKRLLLVFGEHPKYSTLDYIGMTVNAVYSTTRGKSANIRRVNVNAAPMGVEDFAKLKSYGIGTFQCFQETYHRETYRIMHPSGSKSNYEDRILVMHRALDGGIDDIGMGVLYGLYDHRFETLAMIMHAQHLDTEYNIGPHTVSVPRLEPALNAPAAMNPPAPVSDGDFRKLVAALRLALPYTGMILSTRESAHLRDEVIGLGISQISAGSRTNPGGYKQAVENDEYTEQFQIYDTRPLDDVIYALSEKGLMPSMCTACYRLGRTGEAFMEEAKSGHIHNYCLPNAILTYKEYLEDFGSQKARSKGEEIIKEQMQEIENPAMLSELHKKLKRIETGERDIFF